jgi:hypothetical protein
MGFAVTVEPMTVSELQVRFPRGDFDLLVFFGGFDDESLQFLTSGNSRNLSNYRNARFDEAVNSREISRARKIVEEDVPFTPLFAVRSSVAIDARLCGVRPIAHYDLSWLADIHPCAPGEEE